jgi:ketosteroid isomerase-like protein
MSNGDPEIVAMVRRTFDAYSRGDFKAAMENAHPDIELVPAGGQPPIRGAARVRAWMDPDAFESQVVEPLDIRIAGNKVLIQQHNTIRGAGSGIDLDLIMWGVWTLDADGRTTRIEVYLEHQEAEALEAAGLTPGRAQQILDKLRGRKP